MTKFAEPNEVNLYRASMDRARHGSLYDRGGADSWYDRPRDPHWWPEGTGNGQRIDDLDEQQVLEYLAGYEDNEESGGKKQY